MLIKDEEEYLSIYKSVYDIKILNLSNQNCEVDILYSIWKQALIDYDEKFHKGRGLWFPVYSGNRFWPEDPKPEEIHIEDIAHALSSINRFCGHAKKQYSVAQHSVLVSQLLPDEYRLFGLLHDGAESYLSDIITPIKSLIKSLYEPLEEKIILAISKRFNFSVDLVARKAVKKADLIMLMTEIRDLTPSGMYNGKIIELPLEEKIIDYWSAKKSEKIFLSTFKKLYKGN